MAKIKDLAKVAEKWTTVTPGRTQDYVDGVNNPRRSWASATAAGEANWKQGVTQAAAKGRFGQGVKKAGDAKWADGVQKKGAGRWGAGVSQSSDRYAAGFQPYHQAIAAVQLPPRGPRRDPRNLDRVKAVVDAVSKVKESQG